MGWNDAIGWFLKTGDSMGAWLSSADGKVVADWLVAFGTTGAVLFAIGSTLYEAKRRHVLQQVEMMRSFDTALEKRSQIADQISFYIKKEGTSQAFARLAFRRPKRCLPVVVSNPSVYPIHKVALIHEPPMKGDGGFIDALYDSQPFWSVPVVPAGRSETLRISQRTLGDSAAVLLRFETPNATCWAKSEDGRSQLLSDSSLLGVTSERMYAAYVRRSGKRLRKQKYVDTNPKSTARRHRPALDFHLRALAAILSRFRHKAD